MSRNMSQALDPSDLIIRFPLGIAAGVVANNRGNRLVNAVMTDRVRLLIAIWALHFHYLRPSSRPALRLDRRAPAPRRVERKLCSGGRVEAMVMLMRLFGHLAVAPHEEDRRLHRLTPTERLLDWNAASRFHVRSHGQGHAGRHRSIGAHAVSMAVFSR